jgi:hypothetical protein
MRPSVAVVISLSHNTTYTPEEETSFRHVRHYLGRYDKYVLIPESHPAIYPGLLPARFPDRYFAGGQAHGALLLTEEFYSAFPGYEFLLIHHLDTLIFADRLADWCGAGYDYIGHGVSLRRVRSCLRVLQARRAAERWTRLLATSRRYLQRQPADEDDVDEERFWVEQASGVDETFRAAPADVARRFASEADPRSCQLRIHQGLGSEVRLRAPREAREWGSLETQLARLSRSGHDARRQAGVPQDSSRARRDDRRLRGVRDHDTGSGG